MSFTCNVYGLGVQCDCPIPPLGGLPRASNIDLTIRLGILPENSYNVSDSSFELVYESSDVDDNQHPDVCIHRHISTGDFLIRHHDGTRFVIDSSFRNIWSTWPDTLTIEDMAMYLLGPVIGFVLRMKGTTCLHSSAIAIKDQAIVIVGPSGAGKSSTVAMMAMKGYSVLSDDIVQIIDEGTAFRIHSGYPRIRLWAESVESLFGSPDALPQIVPNWEKRFLSLPHYGYSFRSDPLPLAALYFLGERTNETNQGRVTEISPATALMELISDTYGANVLDKTERAREFDVLSRLVQHVPLRRIRPWEDINRLADLCDAIIRDFTHIDQRNI